MTPLPTLPRRSQTETLSNFSARALRFLLSTGCTATLNDEELELAEKAAQLAVANLPAKLERADALVAAHLSEVRHVILLILQDRKAAMRVLPQEVAKHPTPGISPGRLAPLVPPTPVLPPSQARVRVEF